MESMFDFWVETITPPASDAVSIDEAKAQLNIEPDEDYDDLLIARLIRSAMLVWQRWTDRALIEQTLRITKVNFTDSVIDLPGAPLREITALEARAGRKEDWIDNLEGSAPEVTYEYELQEGRQPARILFDTTPQGARVTYTCGYEDRDAIPSDYRDCILQLVAFGYMNRGDVSTALPAQIKDLMQSQHLGTVGGYWSQQADGNDVLGRLLINA